MKKVEKELSPEESIDLVQKIVTKSREEYSHNGSIMILWGIAIIVAILINYMVLLLDLNKGLPNRLITLNWIIIPVLTSVVTVFIVRNRIKKGHYKTSLLRILSYMWIGYGVSLFLVIYMSIFFDHSPIPLIEVVTGFAIFIYGLGLRYRPFIIGSICFGLLAFSTMFITSYPYQLLTYALSMLIGYVIPGVMLFYKVKNNKNDV